MQLPTRQAGPPKRARKQEHQLTAGTPGRASEEDSQSPRATKRRLQDKLSRRRSPSPARAPPERMYHLRGATPAPQARGKKSNKDADAAKIAKWANRGVTYTREQRHRSDRAINKLNASPSL